MAGSSGNKDGDVGFQIAPMIDLILVLLVFFMSTVALKQIEAELGIGLAGTNPREATQIEMIVAIETDGTVSLNSTPVGDSEDKNLLQLRSKLLEQVQLFDDKLPVVISPQSDVVHSRVMDVLNACAGARVKNITFGG